MQAFNQLRDAIEKIDQTIITKLAERKALSEQIGQLKKIEGKSIHDAAREQQLLQDYRRLSTEKGLDPRVVERLFTIILAYSRQLQR